LHLTKLTLPFFFCCKCEPAGFDIDLLAPMFEGTKYSFVPTEYKWNDALVSLLRGKSGFDVTDGKNSGKRGDI